MLKNKALGFYSGCIAVILSLIAICLYLSNISNAYFADKVSAPIVGCTAAAIVLLVAYIVLGSLALENNVVEFCRGLFLIAAVFCLFAACILFLGTRVYNMAIIYGSSLEANNTAAHSAMAQALAAIGFYLAAGIAGCVTAFSKSEKEEIK